MKYVISTLPELETLAQQIARTLKGGAVLCLYGDLGAGKTAFTKALARALGVTETVVSPTFVLMTSYAATLMNSEPVTLYHLDAYRLSSEQEAEGLGLSEIWANPKNIMVIEWADRIAGILPTDRTDIYFTHIDETTREIEVKEHE